MNKFNGLFEVIHVHLDLCLDSYNSKALINSCLTCPLKDFKDEAMTCISLKLTEEVFNILPVIYKTKRRKKK